MWPQSREKSLCNDRVEKKTGGFLRPPRHRKRALGDPTVRAQNLGRPACGGNHPPFPPGTVMKPIIRLKPWMRTASKPTWTTGAFSKTARIQKKYCNTRKPKDVMKANFSCRWRAAFRNFVCRVTELRRGGGEQKVYVEIVCVSFWLPIGPGTL